MLNIAICDDNTVCVQELRACITGILDNKRIQYTITGFTNGHQLLCSGGFDIVFLDIEMEGLDGMETARRLRARGSNCRLVFVTAHEKYALAAFDVEATHYLMKPVDTPKLKSLLDKIILTLQTENEKFITVKQGTSFSRIAIKDILYIEVFDRKLFLHTAQNIYDFYEKLDNLEMDLPDSFFRCHRSYIVNLSHVRHYDKSTVKLDNSDIVLISKRKYGDFCKSFLNFLKKDDEMNE